MSLYPPFRHRLTTRRFSLRLRMICLPALALALLAASLTWTGAAAAACNFLLKFGGTGSGPGQFFVPRGIAVDNAGNVFVPDQNTRVQKFDSSGAFVSQFGVPGDIPGGFVTPWKAATDSAGNVYVSDFDTNRVQKFNSSGVFQMSLGGIGSGPGQFLNGTVGIAVDSAGNIYVADPGNNRVQKFSPAGAFIAAWGGVGTGDGQFSGPFGMAVDAANNIYVADTGNNRIQKFNSSGTFLAKWGSLGTGNGQFDAPMGLAVDPTTGNVYVADTNNNRIQQFSSTGTFIDSCGSAGAGDGQFAGPQDVAVDALGNIYVADTGNERIQKFGAAAASPVADAGADQTVECAGGLTPATLNGTASTPGSGTINSYSWKEGAATLGTGATLNVSLPAGSHLITLTVTDTGGGSDTDDVVVNIVDTMPPTIHVNGFAPLTVECHTNFSDPGATATDGCAGSVAVNASGSVNIDVPGTYTINYSATDGAHTANASRTVYVVDTTAPVISCPADVVITLPPNSPATSMVVNYPAVTATDSCASSVTVASSKASGSVFPAGTTTVDATATDAAGNTSSCSFNVTVLYNFTGFFQPVGNLPLVNMVNAGRAIPVKFSLSGNKGLNIFAPDSPASGPITCNSSDPTTDLQDTVTAGGSSLSYDAATDQYVYVWKTSPAWAGTCRQLVVQLNDGSTHRANFKFK